MKFLLVFFILITGFSKTEAQSYIELLPTSGILKGKTTDTITVSTNEEIISIKFTLEPVSKIKLIVINEYLNTIGKIDLQKKPIVELKGGGDFFLVLIQRKGVTKWTCISAKGNADQFIK